MFEGTEENTIPLYGPGIEGEVRQYDCPRRCHLRATVSSREGKDADAVRVEVLFQGRDDRGLPVGAPTLLYSARWPLTGGRVEGWLPRCVDPVTVRRCYFRIVPTKD